MFRKAKIRTITVVSIQYVKNIQTNVDEVATSFSDNSCQYIVGIYKITQHQCPTPSVTSLQSQSKVSRNRFVSTSFMSSREWTVPLAQCLPVMIMVSLQNKSIQQLVSSNLYHACNRRRAPTVSNQYKVYVAAHRRSTRWCYAMDDGKWTSTSRLHSPLWIYHHRVTENKSNRKVVMSCKKTLLASTSTGFQRHHHSWRSTSQKETANHEHRPIQVSQKMQVATMCNMIYEFRRMMHCNPLQIVQQGIG